MRPLRSFFAWYHKTARAKKHGWWRFPLPVCVGIFILLSPAVLIVEALAAGCVYTLIEAGGLPLELGLFVVGPIWLLLALVIAQVFYFALRESEPDDDYVRCQNCGYNLTGNVSGVCPECGRPTGDGEAGR